MGCFFSGSVPIQPACNVRNQVLCSCKFVVRLGDRKKEGPAGIANPKQQDKVIIRFPESWEYPEIITFKRIFYYKPFILGIPHLEFIETPK